MWSRSVVSGVSLAPTALQKDSSGNLYVLASVRDAGGALRTILLSYDSAGNQRISKIFNYNGANQGRGLDLDSAGNIYVLSMGPVVVDGVTVNGFITAKLDSTGNELWVRSLSDGSIYSQGDPKGLAVDQYDNVYITGQTGSRTYNTKFFTTKYDADGNLLWSDLNSRIYSTLGMIQTLNGAVYIGGGTGYTSQHDSFVLKYDNSNTPPVAEAGEHVAISTDQIAAAVIHGTASDIDGDALTYRWLEGTNELLTGTAVGAAGACDLNIASLYLSSGTHELTLEVSDGIATVTDTMSLTISNSAPNAAAGGGGVYEIGTNVILTGDVSDYDGDLLSYSWMEGETVLCSGNVQTLAEGTPAILTDCIVSGLALGEHAISLTVNDGLNPAVTSTATVQIVDITMPTIEPVASQYILWPPNHQMVDIVIEANAWDNSGLGVTISADVISNEPVEGTGGDDIGPDWTVPTIDQTTGTITLQLRSERSGNGNGRVYTVIITAEDIAGNASSTNVNISVPHDKGKKK
ncbi:MAG: hypothetical protein ISR96_09960 [Nitrospira sp.]|nr:hypothetical protein [Nitrospira sp.]